MSNFYDYRARVQLAAKMARGREMVTIRCPLPDCREVSARVYESPLGPLHESTVPYPEFVAELVNRGEPHDKQISGARVPYATRDVRELVDESTLTQFEVACQRGHVGTVTIADVRLAVDRYRLLPGRPAQMLHAPPEDSV